MKSLIVFFTFLFSSIIYSQNYGSIEGKVVDIQDGAPLVGANVILLDTKLGAATDSLGYFRIRKIPQGKYTLRASYLGFQTFTKTDVIIYPDSISVIEIEMIAEDIIVSPIMITAERPAIQKDATNAIKIAPGETKYIISHNTEEYSKIDEIGFKDVLSYPLSTFSVDVDAASYSNARRFIVQNQMPYKDAVRIEEFINYFDYDYKYPENNIPLEINMEFSNCPWNEEHHLLHIGLQGQQIPDAERMPSNLVFLIDVSGSMSSLNKLPLLKKAFKLFVEQLKPEDKISIVVYAGSAGLVLPSTSGADKKKIISSIEKLQSGGSTAGGEGIKLAYSIAKKNLISGGNNRVILATDGDFNVGISSTSELVRFIEEQLENNIFLTVLGFGMGNYKDDRLQELADRGNGNHAYIDNILEAKKVLVTEINSTLYTIAKDVKIQVEFNPAKVKNYRLLGYENRMLNNEDFEDDKKDAGEIGAGHTVTALYEVELNDEIDISDAQKLKYLETQIKQEAIESDEIVTVRIRYKAPDDDTSEETSMILSGSPISFGKASENFRFSAAVAEFAMILRESEFMGNSSLSSVLKLAESSQGDDEFGYRAEFINLVKRVELLIDK
ncbi:von Willebrand factor type A domain-containing protein [Bacteroidota bacterium]